ncbi:MAG: hypothetical protein GXP47_09805 [Acidobacteria bacterium]|nr:hypothetical protein [Acidobacteriota bacterium]
MAVPSDAPREALPRPFGRRARLAVTVLLASVLAGCASMGGEPPEVTLANLKVVEATLFETTFEATVRITNVRPDPIQARGMALKLYLGGIRIGTGTSPEALEIPGLGSATTTLTIHVNNVAVLTRIKPILDSGAVDYAMKGKLYVASRWGRSNLKLHGSGRIDLDTQSAAPEAGPRPGSTVLEPSHG